MPTTTRTYLSQRARGCTLTLTIIGSSKYHACFRLLTDEYSFLNDTTFTKYVCPDGATGCTSGWVGGDFEKWAPEDSLWNPNEPPKPTPGSGPPGPGAGKKRKKRDVTTSGSGVKKVAPMEVPMITYGAGVSMGLDVMLYAEIDKYFMTSAFFEGFKVLIHRPDEFPLVRDKGFALGPGQEMFVAVDAFGNDLQS
jgi:hypothetical protein